MQISMAIWFLTINKITLIIYFKNVKKKLLLSFIKSMQVNIIIYIFYIQGDSQCFHIIKYVIKNYLGNCTHKIPIENDVARK